MTKDLQVSFLARQKVVLGHTLVHISGLPSPISKLIGQELTPNPLTATFSAWKTSLW